MANIAIQYHASHQENTAFLKSAMAQFNLHGIALSFWPFQALPFEGSQIDELLSITSRFNDIYLLKVKPTLFIEDQFLHNYPDKMLVRVGQQTPEYLSESFLAAIVPRQDKNGIWYIIAKNLKKETGLKGAPIIDGRILEIARHQRFSHGARVLYKSGVKLQDSSGTTFFAIVD